MSLHFKRTDEIGKGYLADLRWNYFSQEARGGNVCIDIAITYEEHDAQRVGDKDEAVDFLHEAGLMLDGEIIPELKGTVTAIRLVPIEYHMFSEESDDITQIYATV